MLKNLEHPRPPGYTFDKHDETENLEQKWELSNEKETRLVIPCKQRQTEKLRKKS